jgi:hypothetical protein
VLVRRTLYWILRSGHLFQSWASDHGLDENRLYYSTYYEARMSACVIVVQGF